MAIAHQTLYPSAQTHRKAMNESPIITGQFYVAPIVQPIGSAPGELEARAINSGDTD